MTQIVLTPVTAARHPERPEARGYLDGRKGIDPRETGEGYEAGWLQGADDRAWLAQVQVAQSCS